MLHELIHFAGNCNLLFEQQILKASYKFTGFSLNLRPEKKKINKVWEFFSVLFMVMHSFS